MQETKKQAADSQPDAQQAQEAEKTQRRLRLLEAALYVAGRPLDLNELCSVLSTRSKKKTKKYTKALIKEYAARNTALEILELKDDRYVLQLKADFTPLVKKLVNISQKRVILVRGQHAYGHVKLLRDMGLVGAERAGRSMTLRTTDYFADYFGLTHDTATMKRELKRIFGEALKEES